MKVLLKSVLKSVSEFLFHSFLGWILSLGSISALIYFLGDLAKELAFLNIRLNLPNFRMYEIVILVAGFVAIIYLIKTGVRYFKKPNNFRFIEDGSFVWKVNRKNGFVFETPYCSVHHIRIVKVRQSGFKAAGIRNNLYCSECGEMVGENVEERELQYRHEFIVNKVELLKDSGTL